MKKIRMRLGRLILLCKMCWAGAAACDTEHQDMRACQSIYGRLLSAQQQGSVIDTLHLAASRANLTLNIGPTQPPLPRTGS